MARASEERRYASAREEATSRSEGLQPYLKLPKGATMFKARKGAIMMDVLPYVVGDGNPNAKPGEVYYARKYWLHGAVGADRQAHLCLRRTMKEPCPVCEFQDKLRQGGYEDDGPDTEKLIKSLMPKERQLFNVYDYKEPDKNVQVWDISFHLFGDLLNERVLQADERKKYDTFFHETDGLSLDVHMVEDSFGGRTFFRASTIDFVPRKDKINADDSFVLDEMLVPTPYDELKKLFHQSVSEDGKVKGRRAEEPARGRERDNGRSEERSSRRERDPAPEPASEVDDRPRGRRDAEERTSRRDREPEPPERGRRDDSEERPRVHSDEERGRRGRGPEPDPAPRGRGREPEAEPASSDAEWDNFAASPKRDDPPARGRSREPEAEPAPRGRREPEPEREERTTRRGR